MKKLKFILFTTILGLSSLIFTSCSSDDSDSNSNTESNGFGDENTIGTNNNYRFTVTTSGNVSELTFLVTLGVENLFEITNGERVKAEVLYNFDEREPGTYIFETEDSQGLNFNYNVGYESNDGTASFEVEIFRNEESVANFGETFTMIDQDFEVISLNF